MKVFSADEVESITTRLTELKNNYSINEINQMEEFKEFKEKNKLLYETIISGMLEPEIFKEMMKMKRRLESGEDQYSVDVRFGEYMAKKYIDPVTKKLNKN